MKAEWLLQGANLKEAGFAKANLEGANFTEDEMFGKVKNLTSVQVKSTCNWNHAEFDPEFQAQLPKSPEPETKVDCSRWGW